MSTGIIRVGLLWHGDRESRDTATLTGSRFEPTADALRAVGIEPVPIIYNDDFADEVNKQLTQLEAVLVWVNPIEQGHDRTMLDAVLSNAATNGVMVSAHPDSILKLGTKEVLISTRDMSWGTDTHMYTTVSQLREQLPPRLAEGRPRVLKQHRGNGGNGIWKVEQHAADPSLLRVRHALRGSLEETLPIAEFIERCEIYLEGTGKIIDQAYQERLPEGMVRCYLVQDQVAGFGHQLINALYPAPAGAQANDAPQPGPRLYFPPTQPEFQAIRLKMENEWVGELCTTLDIEREQLPLIWDADLLYGPKTDAGEDTYVLCEINVSCVTPFPDSALELLAQTTLKRLANYSPSASTGETEA